MKTLIFSIVLVLCANFFQAQTAEIQAQLIELDEAKLSYSPVPLKFSNSYKVTVTENYAREFEKDPLAFMKNNFDINDFISKVQDKNYDFYLVSIRSRKGELQAEFDKVGNLLNTNQRFENIALPMNIRHQLYREHKGWAMVKNVHIARSWKGIVNKDFYRITIKNGKETKNLKIDARSDIRTAMVSN